MKFASNQLYFNRIVPKQPKLIYRNISLPIFITMCVIFLIAYGFWNMYNQEYQKQSTTLKPSSYQDIKAVMQSSRLLMNQLITVSKVGIVDRINNHSFLVSDGSSVLLVVVPSNINIDSLNQTVSNTPQSLALRGKFSALSQDIVKQNEIPVSTNTVLQKQKFYLELTESPQIRVDAIDPSLSDLAESL